MQTNIAAIDLFCGIGGLSYGLQQAGIPVLAGIDLDKSCQYAFEENVKADFISKSVSEIESSFLLEKYWNNKEAIKVLVGCAPCQPFSTHSNKNKLKKENKKWNLIDEFSRLIEETMPHVVSMENVPNLSNQDIFKEFVLNLKRAGYYVRFQNVYCPDYGIPQKRRRLVLLASRFGFVDLIPPTHSPAEYVTTKEAIGHLQNVESGEVCKSDPMHRTTNMTEINLKRIAASKPNGTWMDWDESLRLECHKKSSGSTYKSVYGRIAWNEPSPTITTQFYNYGTGRFGHPDQDRSLSIREGAILQTFPRDYKFYQDEEDISITRLSTHIGNAVPVKLGFIIGRSIQEHIKKILL